MHKIKERDNDGSSIEKKRGQGRESKRTQISLRLLQAIGISLLEFHHQERLLLIFSFSLS